MYTRRCAGKVFGRKSANLWSKHMLNAEGPEAFEDGYRRMQEWHREDEDKLNYITQLYNDDCKAHFKREIPFTNGVLVDLCETLFNAVKVWVYGSARNQRTTLLMALVRIVRGVYNMITKAFLRPVKQIRRINASQNVQVGRMFRRFADKLTGRAVQDMFTSLDRCWLNYVVSSNLDGSVTLTSQAGDEFQVMSDFSCSCEGKQCWQQVHTGLLCNHALTACVHLLKQQDDSAEGDLIMDSAVTKCDQNWHRSTYARVGVLSEYPPPVNVTSLPSSRSLVSCRTERELTFITRFREVLRFVSPKLVEEHLHSLESDALSDIEVFQDDEDSESIFSDSISCNSGSISNSSVQTDLYNVSNPPSRRSKRKRYMDNDMDD